MADILDVVELWYSGTPFLINPPVNTLWVEVRLFGGGLPYPIHANMLGLRANAITCSHGDELRLHLGGRALKADHSPGDLASYLAGENVVGGDDGTASGLPDVGKGGDSTGPWLQSLSSVDGGSQDFRLVTSGGSGRSALYLNNVLKMVAPGTGGMGGGRVYQNNLVDPTDIWQDDAGNTSGDVATIDVGTGATNRFFADPAVVPVPGPGTPPRVPINWYDVTAPSFMPQPAGSPSGFTLLAGSSGNVGGIASGADGTVGSGGGGGGFGGGASGVTYYWTYDTPNPYGNTPAVIGGQAGRAGMGLLPSGVGDYSTNDLTPPSPDLYGFGAAVLTFWGEAPVRRKGWTTGRIGF